MSQKNNNPRNLWQEAQRWSYGCKKGCAKPSLPPQAHVIKLKEMDKFYGPKPNTNAGK